MEPTRHTIELTDATISAAQWGAGPPDIVLLHDGLGSIAQWRSVPALIAERSGSTVLAYDRPGHGASTPVPTGPWPANWLRTEAHRLADLLDATGAETPLIVGHSDGGSIALIHGAGATSSRGIVALAAHSWVEQAAVDEISRLRGSSAAVVAGLARHHQAPAELFEAWSGAWVGTEFAPFDLRPELATIQVPTLVAQGTADEFATDRQAEETAAAIGANAACRLLPDVRHLMHHDDEEFVADLIVDFDRSLDS